MVWTVWKFHIFTLTIVLQKFREIESFSAKNPKSKYFSSEITVFSHCTVWKFQVLSITQILREINFEESKSFFAISDALNCVNLGIFNFQKEQKFIKSQKPKPLNMLK